MKKYYSLLLLVVPVFAFAQFERNGRWCVRVDGAEYSCHNEIHTGFNALEKATIENPLSVVLLEPPVYVYHHSVPIDPPVDPPIDPPVDPPVPPTQTQWRGVPDPSVHLGFDIFADYPAQQTITGNQGNRTLTCNGTAQAPCLIDATNATFTKLNLSGSYVILQGGLVTPPGTDGAHISICSFCVARDVTAKGPKINTGGDSVVGMSANSVWLRGKIHSFGDNRIDAPENDNHGFKVMSDNVWILNAEAYDLAGDSVQVGDASRGAANNVYIAGGLFYNNRENGVDVKDATNIVISGNTMYGFRATPGNDPGAAVVIHDDAYGVKVYENTLTDTNFGVVTSGIRDHEIVDNTIEALSKGIECRNTQNLTIRGNTITAPTPFDRQSNCNGDLQL